MCEINAYIFKDGNEVLFLENVDTIKQADGRVVLKNLFGEQKEFEGMIRELSFRKNKVILEKR